MRGIARMKGRSDLCWLGEFLKSHVSRISGIRREQFIFVWWRRTAIGTSYGMMKYRIGGR
jgi:hypothetical protein